MSQYNIYTKEQFEGEIKRHSKYDLNQTGYWKVLGSDTNCDWGGNHVQPFLGIVKGRFEDALRWACRHPQYFCWGGGDVDLIEIVEV